MKGEISRNAAVILVIVIAAAIVAGAIGYTLKPAEVAPGEVTTITTTAPGGGVTTITTTAPGGGVTTITTTAPVTTTAQPTVSLAFFHDKAGDTPIATFDNVFKAFSKSVGGSIKVAPSVFTADTLQAAIRPLLGDPNCADVFTWWCGTNFENLAAAGYLADVTSIWQKYADKVPKGLSDYYSYGGKQYGIPSGVNYWPVFYDPATFEKYGLKVPETWDDFLNVCETLKSNGVTPIVIAGGHWWTMFPWPIEILIRTDPDFYIRLGAGEAKFTDPEMETALKTWLDMVEKGYFDDPEVMLAAKDDATSKRMAAGEAGMWLIGDWKAGGFKTEGWDTYATFLLPSVNPEVGWVLTVEPAPIVVSAASSNLDAALKLVDWWMSAEAQRIWSKGMNYVPVNSDVDPAEVLTPALAQEGKAIVDKNPRVMLRAWEVFPPDVMSAFIDAVDYSVLHPETYKEQLANVQKVAESLGWSK